MEAMNRLLGLMKSLRDPDTGCPWDREQTLKSIMPHTLEEAYELIDAIEREHMEDICDELGDLLFHVIFYAEIASETGGFDFNEVAEKIASKLQRRHPHVFGDEKINSIADLNLTWERIKQEERETKNSEAAGYLDGISQSLPAMKRSIKLQKRAATVGFDWDSLAPVMEKVEEEITELKNVLNEGGGEEEISNELGDLLFACVNLARHLKVEPEFALRKTNRKFESRFRFMEEKLHSINKSLEDCSIEEMEKFWQEAKSLD